MKTKKRTAQSSSRNATKHGMRQEHFCLLPGESQAEFDAMAQPWREQYAKFITKNPAAGALLNEFLERKWREIRSLRRIDELEADLFEAQLNNDAAAETTCERRLQNAYRYKTSNENSANRTLKALEAFRATRVREDHRHSVIELKACALMENIALQRWKHNVPADLPEVEIPKIDPDLDEETDQQDEIPAEPTQKEERPEVPPTRSGKAQPEQRKQERIR